MPDSMIPVRKLLVSTVDLATNDANSFDCFEFPNGLIFVPCLDYPDIFVSNRENLEAFGNECLTEISELIEDFLSFKYIKQALKASLKEYSLDSNTMEKIKSFLRQGKR